MIKQGTLLRVADNSGAKALNVIRIVERGNKQVASVGGVVIASVRGASSTGHVQDHEIVRTVIVRTKKEVRRGDGSYIRFDDNAAVIIDKHGNPRATRVFGPIAREVKEAGFDRIASLAKEVY